MPNIGSTPPAPLQHRSPGITSIYNELKRQGSLRVLDLGSSSAKSFNFFRNLSCQIHFEGLDEFLANPQQASLPHAEMIKPLADYLTDFGATRQFDLILTWDLFNYLEIDTIHWLLKRLNPNCRDNTLVHSIRYVANQIPISPRRFHILNQYDTQADSETPTAKRRHSHFSTATLMKGLPQFQIERSFLNFEGMLPGFAEQLLRFQPTHKPQAKRQTSDELNQDRYRISQSGQPHSSAALEKLFQNLREAQEVNVLDLGLQNRHNYDVLNQITSNVYAEDLFSAITLQVNAGKTPTLKPYFLNFTDGECFDAILLWDILNFLPDDLIKELFVRLEPFTNSGTLIHAVVYSGKSIPARPQHFHIVADGSLEIFKSEAQNCTTSLTSSKILKSMPGFQLADTFIYRPGMQRGVFEYLFRRRLQP